MTAFGSILSEAALAGLLYHIGIMVKLTTVYMKETMNMVNTMVKVSGLMKNKDYIISAITKMICVTVKANTFHLLKHILVIGLSTKDTEKEPK